MHERVTLAAKSLPVCLVMSEFEGCYVWQRYGLEEDDNLSPFNVPLFLISAFFSRKSGKLAI